MEFTDFIGIDVSKDTLDAHIYHVGVHAKFDNTTKGFDQISSWVKGHGLYIKSVFVVFEHTGLYSLMLSEYLTDIGCLYHQTPGLAFKNSQGMRRGKDDPSDAKALAEYAFEKHWKLPHSQPLPRPMAKIKRLLSLRERLVSERAGFKNRLNAYKGIISPQQEQTLYAVNEKMIAALSGQIECLEREMDRLLKEDPEMNSLFGLLNTIKGVGPQTATYLIVFTQAFTKFKSHKQFASYCGVAPFPNQSGKQAGKHRISHLANKRIKALLSCCAASAIQNDPQTKAYYLSKIEQGKDKMCVINAVRNKILARIFAVAKRGTPYVDIHAFAH